MGEAPSAAELHVCEGDNLPLLEADEPGRYRLIYLDPPFNTGKTQRRTTTRAARDAGGRVGFGERRYRSVKLGSRAFEDVFDDYLGWLEPRLVACHRLLAADGSLFLHLDYREVHYAKVLLDCIFGRECFINEIIWAYDYGGRTKRRWPPKHDNILWYARDPRRYVYRLEASDRIPYMAPRLVGAKKASRGKTPTDTWWHTIVSPTSREKTGYPTQKPRGVIERLVAVHSEPGDWLLDPFAGSGTTGEVAHDLGRHARLIDRNPEAIAVMRARFEGRPATWHAAT